MAEAVQHAADNAAAKFDNEPTSATTIKTEGVGSDGQSADAPKSSKSSGGLYTTWEGAMPKDGEIRRKPVEVDKTYLHPNFA